MNTNMLGCPTCGYAERISQALDIAFSFGQSDGSHHKAWVIDRMVRALLTDTADGNDSDYRASIKEYEQGGEYEWDRGIAP